jgi:hypothetical protein
MSEAAKHTARTVVQTVAGLCVLLPVIVGAAGVQDTLPWAAGAVAVAGGLARAMAMPGAQSLVPSWMRTGTPATSDRELLALTAAAPAAVPPAPATPQRGSGA